MNSTTTSNPPIPAYEIRDIDTADRRSRYGPPRTNSASASSPPKKDVRVSELATVLGNLPHLTPDELDSFEADIAEVRQSTTPINTADRDAWQS